MSSAVGVGAGAGARVSLALLTVAPNLLALSESDCCGAGVAHGARIPRRTGSAGAFAWAVKALSRSATLPPAARCSLVRFPGGIGAAAWLLPIVKRFKRSATVVRRRAVTGLGPVTGSGDDLFSLSSARARARTEPVADGILNSRGRCSQLLRHSMGSQPRGTLVNCSPRAQVRG